MPSKGPSPTASAKGSVQNSTQNSTQSSRSSSLKSVRGAAPAIAVAPATPGTGTPAAAGARPAGEKSSVRDRLSRMFSSRDPSTATTPRATSPRPAASKATSPSRHPSSARREPARFTSLSDGGHEHCLRPHRRQETLLNTWKTWLGMRKAAEEDQDEDTTPYDLSLMSSYQHGIPKTSEPKTGPAASATFVEKYGKCQEIVGRGAFGIVRISHKKLPTGQGEQLFAVKEFCRHPNETERKYSKRLTSEFCISSGLRHANVIRTLDLLQDDRGIYCEVMEYCSGGDLYTLILAAGKLQQLEADCYFKQLMRGVNYLHENGVAHRDLKPENLLLTKRGALKITDFGNGECFRMAWESETHLVSGLCGSAPYIAPEEYTDREFDARAVDVWACGVIYMAMRTGRHLWHVAKKHEDEFYDAYLAGRREEAGYGPIEDLPRARCRNVIYSILDPNPTRRLTCAQVLKSEWSREIVLCKAASEEPVAVKKEAEPGMSQVAAPANPTAPVPCT